MQADRTDALRRLATIEGHLRGIRKMVEDDVYCVDILRQTYAVQRAIAGLETVLVKSHLQSCVPQAFAEGRSDEALAELTELFQLAQK